MAGIKITNLGLMLLCFMVISCQFASAGGFQSAKETFQRISQNRHCDMMLSAKINETYTIGIDSHEINPPCGVALIGIQLENITEEYNPFCYTVTQINIPCGVNNSITISIVPINENITEYDSTTYYCNSTKSNLNIQLCLKSRFLVWIQFLISTPESDSFTGISFHTMFDESVPREYYYQNITWPTNHTRTSLVSGFLCTINDSSDECLIEINSSDEKGEDKEEDSKKSTLDLNNLITIIGGIVTTLFAPMILLCVRHVISNRRKTMNSPRNPGDGEDHVDGSVVNDDDDDDDTEKADIAELIEKVSTSKLLSSPRHSFFSDDISFHSATSTLDHH